MTITLLMFVLMIIVVWNIVATRIAIVKNTQMEIKGRNILFIIAQPADEVK